MDVFRSPEEINVDYLQEAAMDGIKEYKDVKMSQVNTCLLLVNTNHVTKYSPLIGQY